MSTVEAVLARFESQLGVTESPLGSNRVAYNDWYGIGPAPWCATFLSWCFFHAGLALPASTPKGFAYTPSGAAWFAGQGRWTTSPGRGHVVFFDFPGDRINRISHVGIVSGVGAGFVDTIEGNTDERGGRTGGKVMRRRRSSGIVGYGVPTYRSPTPIQEDDMAYRYVFDGAIWTTDFVHRQKWEAGGEALAILDANTRDLGPVPADFHNSLTPADA